MTVPATEAQVSYSGAGSTGPFSFPFYFLSGADLVVTKIETDGNIVSLELDTSFTVTGEGESAGGDVTLTDALAVGETLSIVLEPVNEQDTTYTGDSPFPSQATEQALDLLTMITKRLQAMQTRGREAITTSSSGVITLDLSEGIELYKVTLTENITEVAIDNPPPAGTFAKFILEMTQDGTGGWTYTTANAIHSGDALVTTAGTINRIFYTCDFAGDLTGVIHADFD